MRTRIMLLALSPLVFALAGCGSENYPVEGKVVFEDGRTAAANTSIMFTSEDGLSSGYGTIKEDGTFTLTFDDPGKGAPVGKYKISFTPRDTLGLTAEQIAAIPKIRGKYLKTATSGLEAEIKAEKNYFEFTLENPDGLVQASATDDSWGTGAEPEKD